MCIRDSFIVIAVVVIVGLLVFARHLDQGDWLIRLALGLQLGGATGNLIDRLHQASGLRLVALFAPEHGIRGTVADGDLISSGRDARTGLPIHSLYGETRKPTPAMLEGIDALLFDIQDVGARQYTYIWTMYYAMEAAAERRIPFVVLDRPNPIGGEIVEGNILAPAFSTFVGLKPVPIRYGLTIGELARFCNAEFKVGAELTVVPVAGWSPFASNHCGGA